MRDVALNDFANRVSELGAEQFMPLIQQGMELRFRPRSRAPASSLPGSPWLWTFLEFGKMS